MPEVVTVFSGDTVQFLTGGVLLSTPHKVKLNTRERFAMANFHEPFVRQPGRAAFGQNRTEGLKYCSRQCVAVPVSWPADAGPRSMSGTGMGSVSESAGTQRAETRYGACF